MRDYGSGTEQWSIGGTLLHTVAADLTVVPEPAGSALRGDDILVSRAPGRRWRRKYPEPQLLSFVLEVSDVDEFGRDGALFDNIDRVRRLLRGLPGQVTVERRTITADGGLSVRAGLGELVDPFDVEVNRNVTFARCAFSLLLADPYLYEPARTISGTGTFVLNNPGTALHHNAVVRINGPAASPTLSCATTGTTFTLSTTIGTGDWVEVDTGLFTAVTDASVDVSATIVRSQPALLELAAGVNELELSAGACTITWKPAHL